AEHVLEPLEELDQRTRPGRALVGDRLEQVAQPLHSDARGVNGVLIARGAGGLELLLEHGGLLAQQPAGGCREGRRGGTRVHQRRIEPATHAALDPAKLRRDLLTDIRVRPVLTVLEPGQEPRHAGPRTPARLGAVSAYPAELDPRVAPGAGRARAVAQPRLQPVRARPPELGPEAAEQRTQRP